MEQLKMKPETRTYIARQSTEPLEWIVGYYEGSKFIAVHGFFYRQDAIDHAEKRNRCEREKTPFTNRIPSINQMDLL